MKHRLITVTLAALLVVCMTGAVLLLRRIDRTRANATLEEVLYVPSPHVLKHMSLGYNGFLADIYWTRAVQYFGGKHHQRSSRYDLLAPLLDITTELDPHLLIAYRFGSIFLAQQPPEGAGRPDQAAALVERGIRANPDDWHLYYDLGFLQYMELRDPAAAARAFERGARVPGAHPFLKVLAAIMAQRAGNLETARLLWTMTYETTSDALVRDNALKHLRALRVDEDVPRLQALVQQYARRTGHLPASFITMVEAGYLRAIPVDPVGHPYKLAAGGRVEVVDPDSLPFITEGLPPGTVPFSSVLESAPNQK